MEVPRLLHVVLAITAACAHGEAPMAVATDEVPSAVVADKAPAAVPPVAASDAPEILVELRWNIIPPQRSIWRAASEAPQSWTEARPGVPDDDASFIAGSRRIEDFQLDCARLCEGAFDMLAALPESVLRAAHGPDRDELRTRHLWVPDRQLHFAVQQPIGSFVDVMVNLKSGGYGLMPDIETGTDNELCFAWSGDGKRLAFVSLAGIFGSDVDHYLCVLDVAPGAVAQRFQVPHEPLGLAWSPDAQRVAVLGVDRRDPDPSAGRLSLLLSPAFPFVYAGDAYVTVVDLPSGDQTDSLLARDRLDIQGHILWDDQCVASPRWKDAGGG